MAVQNRIDNASSAPGLGAPVGLEDALAVLRRLLEGGCAARALPAPRRLAPPPATNEHVRKSMKGNKRANTKPELLVRARLRAAGLGGYRLQWKVPGHPDVAWPGKKTALFINGCFWHRCPRCKPRMPKSNVEYWVVKFQRNVERDERSVAALEAMGWKVHIIWECQLKKKEIDATFAELLPVLAEELGKKLRA
ncbi:very short patch repair endonuclease [Gordonibacter sp. An230]|uniref:very short patch repair endonuclease n=1 Tax=Gordonibacter sp. An230 TaxID=1965592 RepID=UPI000B3926A3|nr:very short patch repair endonuclease [Gordonibacter sp. An230]OUO86757.1 very short patch repair endonuclease [Gordonibacter sp. An230]